MRYLLAASSELGRRNARAKAIVMKGLDVMDTQTLLIILILVLLLGEGGWYGRGRWF